MSDLIRRSEAIQRLIQETIDSKNNLIHINTVKRLLQDVDTAYDVDNVVQELEKDSSVKLYGSGNSDNYLIPVKRAIEIVKAGGKNEID